MQELQKTDHWPFLVAIFYSLLLLQKNLKGGEVGCYQQYYGHSLQTCTTALDTASYTFLPPPPSQALKVCLAVLESNVENVCVCAPSCKKCGELLLVRAYLTSTRRLFITSF